MNIKLNENGIITIKPVKLIDSDQAYFYTKENITWGRTKLTI